MTATTERRRRPRRSPCGTNRGSVLMLMPAAVVIVLLLGAIAVDSAIVYLEQRQAYNVAFDAANDAAGAAIDRDIARRSGEIVYDPGRVREVAAATVAAAGLDELTLIDARNDDGTIVVTVEVRVKRLFGQAFGAESARSLTISARALGEVRGP